MDKHLKKISISFTLSCLLLNFGYGSMPCQNGHDYDNKCDPYYNINLIQAKTSDTTNSEDRQVTASNSIASSSKKSHKIETKVKGIHRQSDLSYLDSLRSRYSSQFNGKMGLQSIIDRSKYTTIKNIEIEDTKKSKKKVSKKVSVKTKKVKKKANSKHIAAKSKTTKDSKHTIHNKVKKTKKIVISKKEVKKTHKKAKKTVKKSTNSKFYIVKTGDSLIKIANKFSTDKSKIVSLNKLDKNATIKIGQKLILPSGAKSVVKIAKTKKINKTIKKSKKREQKGIYVVQKGDTISSIAAKNKISLIKLRKINKLSRSGKIKVGQKLTLVAPKVKTRKNKYYDFVKNTKFRKSPSSKFKRKIRVVATAYTSHVGQTDKTPFLAAWNNRIRPGMKIIAVSPDLIKKYGLTNGVKVKILGLPGHYVVRDKMNARLRNHIDIYMGVNKHRALQWGRKRIVLYW